MAEVHFGRRVFLAALAAATFTVGAEAAARPGIPVRVRIIRGSRQGPPSVDPRLGDVQGQLSRLAYQKWEQAHEQEVDADFGKTVQIAIPGGSPLELTLVDSRKETVTFQIKVGGGAHSKVTISKDQRIVHQCTQEKEGAAYFAAIRPWPAK
jgi:hypothetical protein